MWNLIDNYNFDKKYFEDIDDMFNCDICKNYINGGNFYCIRKHNIDICNNCYPNKNNIFKIEMIDRINYSIEDKPLIWSCMFCDKKLGGGCKWYAISKNLEYETPFDDICMDCYDLDKIYDYYNSKFIEINLNNYKLCNRLSDATLINILNASSRNIPTELENEITTERMEIWIDLLSSIVNIDLSFGPIKNWCLISDIYELPLFNASTAVLLECCGNNRIASLLIDDHGRVSCDIIFDNYNDYLNDKNNWKCKYVKDSDEHIKELKIFKKLLNKVGEIEEDEFKNVLLEYSGYIRISRKLDIYYG